MVLNEDDTNIVVIRVAALFWALLFCISQYAAHCTIFPQGNRTVSKPY